MLDEELVVTMHGVCLWCLDCGIGYGGGTGDSAFQGSELCWRERITCLPKRMVDWAVVRKVWFSVAKLRDENLRERSVSNLPV